MLPHAYYSEIAQTLAAGIGFALGIWAVWDAWGEGVFWRGEHDRDRIIGHVRTETAARLNIAEVHLKSELATVVAMVVLLIVGVSGLFLRPPEGYSSYYDNEQLGIAISRYGMTLVTCVLAYKSLIRRKGRMSYVRTRRMGDPNGGRVTLPSPVMPSRPNIDGNVEL